MNEHKIIKHLKCLKKLKTVCQWMYWTGAISMIAGFLSIFSFLSQKTTVRFPLTCLLIGLFIFATTNLMVELLRIYHSKLHHKIRKITVCNQANATKSANPPQSPQETITHPVSAQQARWLRRKMNSG